jgi:type III pantothenate kinase
MDLLLDAGNTRLKWGLRDGAGWRGQGAVALGALDELAGVLEAAGPIRRVLGANVAGAEVAARLAGLLAGRAGAHLDRADGVGLWRAQPLLDPARLGADRWAALVGARALHGARRWW